MVSVTTGRCQSGFQSQQMTAPTVESKRDASEPAAVSSTFL